MNDKIQIYLAGTIYNDEPSKSWKDRFISSMDETGIDYKVYDPKPQDECNLTMVARDKSCIEKSDIFVAYIDIYTVGTSMEIYHAFLQNNIPIIIITPDIMSIGRNIWIAAHCHLIVNNVEDAVEYISKLI